MTFGKVGLNPKAFVGFTKAKFKKHFKGKELYFRPYKLDEVWDKFKSEIPKK